MKEEAGGDQGFQNTITPVLTVRNAAQAVAFYERAFGAQEIHRNTYPDGRIVVEMAVGDARFRVADEAPEAANLGPQTLGSTTVRINLLVVDPDGLAAQAIAAGADEVAPIADQPYGLRQGRLVDLFGHHWQMNPVPGRGGPGAKSPAVAMCVREAGHSVGHESLTSERRQGCGRSRQDW